MASRELRVTFWVPGPLAEFADAIAPADCRLVEACGSCGVDSETMVLVQNNYGDWLCLPCNEWVYRMTIEPYEYDHFTPEDVERVCTGDQPWMHVDYVPAGAERL